MRYGSRFWLLLALATRAAADPAPPEPVKLALAEVNHAIAAERDAQHIPGMAVAIIHGSDLIWQNEIGFAELNPARSVVPETGFGIGSISKLFTAVAIMQLRDAGRLDLDDRVRKHLPWFRLAGDADPRITLRELLLQLGGMAREPIGASWADQTMPTRDAIIRNMPDEPETLLPETRWKYSNLGYAVLGLVVEAVSGDSYSDYISRHIVVPLGMTGTEVGPAGAPEGMAVGYGVPVKGQRPPRRFLAMGGTTPAAGIVTTAADLGRFAAWMLGTSDDAILSAQSRREMERVQAMMPEWSAGQGLGFEIHRNSTSFRIGHAGRAGGFAGAVEIDPETRVGVVVLTNADDGTVRRLIDRTIVDISAAYAAATPHRPEKPDPAWTKYVGIYAFDGRRSEIAMIGGRLVWQDPEAANPADTRIFLEPVGPDTFRFTSGGLVGENLIFERDASGDVRRMLAGGGYDWKQ